MCRYVTGVVLGACTGVSTNCDILFFQFMYLFVNLAQFAVLIEDEFMSSNMSCHVWHALGIPVVVLAVFTLGIVWLDI